MIEIVCQCLWLPQWSPPSLNLLLGHWAQRNRLKAAVRDLIAVEAARQGLRPATGKRRVSLRILLPPKQRKIDPGNARKALDDALKHARLILDDSSKWLEEGPIWWARTEQERPETFVLLEDCCV